MERRGVREGATLKQTKKTLMERSSKTFRSYEILQAVWLLLVSLAFFVSQLQSMSIIN
jgi:hypothetical protein